jgi:hypothetical protein
MKERLHLNANNAKMRCLSRNMFLVLSLLLSTVQSACVSQQVAGTLDFGHGFRAVMVSSENPPEVSERVRIRYDLFYRHQKIDESSYVDISPSGRFAVYESSFHSGIVLFDSRGKNIYRVVEYGTVPTVTAWGDEEEYFVVTYYVDGDTTNTERVPILGLRRMK